MEKGEKVFITGGAGFIGCALVRHFLDAGLDVTIYDSLRRNALRYFPELSAHPRLTVVAGDVRDAEKLAQVVGEPHYVFHLAAIAGVSKYFAIPAEVMQVNVLGTFNILEAIKGQRQVKAFFDFSTSECYGSHCFMAREDGDVKMENMFEKRWTYATSKIASEKIGMAYHWQYGVPFIGIRPFNIFGPGQVGEGVISKFLSSVLREEPIRVTGKGSQCRTYCFIEDFVAGIAAILANLDRALGTSLNIGRSDEIISVLNLAELVCEIAGIPQNLQFVAHQGEDVMVRPPDITRIQSLGFEPRVRLKEGLRRTLDWYRAHRVEID